MGDAEDGDSMIPTPVDEVKQEEGEDGCLYWDVMLEKESVEDKFGFVQANGKLEFETRFLGLRALAEAQGTAFSGPHVLIVRRIHEQGLLHAWNLRHPEAQVYPQDRICKVNFETT